jgi:hypothetical protein
MKTRLASAQRWIRERARRCRPLRRILLLEARTHSLLQAMGACDDCGGVFLTRTLAEVEVSKDKKEARCRFCLQKFVARSAAQKRRA